MRQLPALVSFLLVLGLAFIARAQDPLSLTWEVTSGRINFTIRANQPLQDLQIEIRETPNGSPVRQTRASLAADQSWTFSRREPRAPQVWRLDLKGKSGGAEFDGWFELPFGPVPSIDFELRESEFRASDRWFVVRPNADVVRTRLVVRGESGEVVLQSDDRVNLKAGQDVRVFLPVEEPILTVEYLMETSTGANREYRYIPWELKAEIRSLNFDSGQATIHADDMPILRDTLEQVASTVSRLGGMVPLELYVGGYTDTVGTTASNDSLSRNRARAIARFMRENGVEVPIYYQGFGERVPVENLGDNVPSEANRRAVFVLRAGKPDVNALFPNDRWERL